MPMINKAIKRQSAITIFFLIRFINRFIDYKSKTEVRFVYMISFIRIQKAKNKYKAKPNPTVTKVRYINEVLTTLARIPKRSAIRWQT